MQQKSKMQLSILVHSTPTVTQGVGGVCAISFGDPEEPVNSREKEITLFFDNKEQVSELILGLLRFMHQPENGWYGGNTRGVNPDPTPAGTRDA